MFRDPARWRPVASQSGPVELIGLFVEFVFASVSCMGALFCLHYWTPVGRLPVRLGILPVMPAFQ